MSAFDYLSAADTTNMQAGGDSIFDGVGDALTLGVGAALVSGAHGLYNTGVDLTNKVFGTTYDRADTAQALSQLDDNWGDYYQQHQGAIDVGGFIAGSLVPGTLAVKGLKMAQAGEALGAFSRVVGYSTKMENAYLNKALVELGTEGGTVFQRINTAKLASIAWGTADNVLQTAAFETAAALAMKSSPMLDNEDWKHISWDILTSSLTGGLIGGGINGLLTNRLLKDAGKLVEGKQRIYDRMANPGALDLAFGDKAFAISDTITDLPKEVFDPVVKLTHGREGLKDSLDLTGLLEKTRRRSVEMGLEKLQSTITNVVKDDVSVGTPLAKSLLDTVKQGFESGADERLIKQTTADLLLNLKSVEGIGNRPLDLSGEIKWINPNADITKQQIFTNSKQIGDVAYRVIGDEGQARIAVLGRDAATKTEAFAAGFDTVIDPTTKKISVSPFSKIYAKVDGNEGDFTSMFYNTQTKKMSADTVPTIADVALGPKDHKLGLNINFTGVQSGSKSYVFKTGEYMQPADSIEATARHVWADALPVIKGTVSTEDISVLDALARDPKKAADGLMLRDPRTGATTLFADIHDFDTWVFRNKVAETKATLERLGTEADLRDVAYRMNVTGDWLQNSAIGSKFDAKTMYNDIGWAPPTARLLERENLVMRYDTAAIKAANTFPDAIVAFNSRVKEAQDKLRSAAAGVLGREDYALLQPIDQALAATADSQNTGASLLGASNANYTDKLRAWAQYTGQLVANISTKRTSANLSVLQSPAAKLLQNPLAAAEVAAATEAGRLSTEKLALYTDPRHGSMLVDLESFNKVKNGGVPTFAKRIPLSEDAADFFRAHTELHAGNVEQQNTLFAAHGVATRWNPDQVYFPPVDTQRVPFFAFVRQRDGTLFGSSEVSMITARSSAELQGLISQVEKDTNLFVITKDGSEAYHKAKGDYDFSRLMNEPVIDPTLRKQGKLGNYLPNMTPEAVIEDYVQFHQRAVTKLVRDSVSANYAQQIAELQDLSSRYTQTQTSKFEGLSQLLQRNVQDPFGDTIKLALNISKRGEFTLLHQANEFVDALGTGMWRPIGDAIAQAKEGKISFEEANGMLEKFGLGRHFSDQTAFELAQHAPDRNILKVALQKANMLLANGMLRLDWANSILNVISTPILLGTEVSSIKNSMKNDAEMMKFFNDVTNVTVPGTAIQMPSTAKLVYKAVADYAKDPNNLLQRFKDIGTVKGPAALFHQMMDEISLTPKLVPSAYAAKVDSWLEKGASLTFSNQAEDFTRYVTSHVMWQLTEPAVKKGVMSVQEQNAFITIFTNRVQGNYIAAQRPIAFQGTIGSAVGLFQTYQFNMMQQLFRHIENRDMKTMAVMGGLQSSMFGLNGLPMFGAINTQIVGNASINEGHKDAYSYAVSAAGKEWGDWLMYGTASAFPLFSEQAPALYTRGDLNPRGTFILPTSPMDVPAVAGSLKVVKALLGMGQQVLQGADMGPALLAGLEHNGVSRPLAGLAQVLKGNATTAKGDLISAASDWNSIAIFSRLIGAKPMDESIALNTLYRSSAYQAADKAKIDELGSVIKDKLRGGQQISPEDWLDFQGKYAAAGGRIQGFGAAIHRWDKAANVSAVNEVMRHNMTPAGQRMISVLGGDPLQDYRNQVPE